MFVVRKYQPMSGVSNPWRKACPMRVKVEKAKKRNNSVAHQQAARDIPQYVSLRRIDHDLLLACLRPFLGYWPRPAGCPILAGFCQ
jgi:hypothetical protein